MNGERNNMFGEELLLARFNERDKSAFGEVYSLYYKEFYRYACNLYYGTEVQAEDVIHDIFLKLWSARSLRFDLLLKLKGYVYVSIKNSFKDHVKHTKHIATYAGRYDAERYFTIDVIENEMYAILEESCDILPAEHARIFRMLLEGWKPGQIAEKIGRTQQYVYNCRYEALKALRDHIVKHNLLSIFFF